VHPQIRAALEKAEHLCVDTTGASPEILDDLLALAPPRETLVVRVHAPLATCLARIAARDPARQIPADRATIEKVYALSVTAPIDAAFTLENVALSDREIADRFREALRPAA
jgi:chloramphenicol 3-O-phosphotransferase